MATKRACVSVCVCGCVGASESVSQYPSPFIHTTTLRVLGNVARLNFFYPLFIYLFDSVLCRAGGGGGGSYGRSLSDCLAPCTRGDIFYRVCLRASLARSSTRRSFTVEPPSPMPAPGVYALRLGISSDPTVPITLIGSKRNGQYSV